MRFQNGGGGVVVDEAWIEAHPADEGPVTFTERVDPVGDLRTDLERWAVEFARRRFGTKAELRLGRRGLHPDESASFLAAVEAGDVKVDGDGSFTVAGAVQKPDGQGRYNLFSASSSDGEPVVALNTEYLIQAGATSELARLHGFDRSDVEFEVGQFDARVRAEGRVGLLMEAKARVDGPDGLAALFRSFLRYASDAPPAVGLLLVAAGARWSFIAERAADGVSFTEVDRPAAALASSDGG